MIHIPKIILTPSRHTAYEVDRDKSYNLTDLLRVIQYKSEYYLDYEQWNSNSPKDLPECLLIEIEYHRNYLYKEVEEAVKNFEEALYELKEFRIIGVLENEVYVDILRYHQEETRFVACPLSEVVLTREVELSFGDMEGFYVIKEE